MTEARTSPADGRRLLVVAVYYVTLIAAGVLLARAFPGVDLALPGAGAPTPGGEPFTSAGGAPQATAVAQTPWAGGLLGGLSMLSALALMVPVTWVYMVARRRRGFDESVVHTLLVLPVAVTGIVMIVQNSLALAFSLAGIVAAVRFRTTLDDTKDAVYVFLAIGVGLACGVQALGLALVLTLIFNGVVLALWATRFGDPDAAAPAPVDLSEPDGDPARAARLARHLAVEQGRKKGERANALLVVRGPRVEPTQEAVEPVLGRRAARWRLADVVPVEGGGWTLEYLVRLEAPSDGGGLLDEVASQGDGVVAVELRTLQGVKGSA